MQSNMPTGDVWKLVDDDADSQYFRKAFRFDFTYIASKEIKTVLKLYVWRNFRVKNCTLGNLYSDLLVFKHFYGFAESRTIVTFKNLSNNEVTEFISYLRVKVSERTGKSLSYLTQKGCLDTLKSIIHWCQIHLPGSVPDKEIFTGHEYRGVNRKLRIDFIPDDVIMQINEALRSEENPYIKYGIIICESTGMRSGDLLLLKTDCIRPHPINGYIMEWFEHKTRKARVPIPVTSECADAVKKLIDVTKTIRGQANADIKDHLFIYSPIRGRSIGKVTRVSKMLMMKWLKEFAEHHSIFGSDKKPYDLTFHKFRRTLATDMLSKGTNIKVIQEVLGHASVVTTKRYYADIKDAERAEIFKSIGVIGNVSQIDESCIPDTVELQWFLSNRNGAARMCDGYCTKPIQGGEICDRLLNRQKCYTCSRYITTVDNLEAHKDYLKELELLVERNIYGKHYEEHFTPVIEALKEIIRRLEALKSDSK